MTDSLALRPAAQGPLTATQGAEQTASPTLLERLKQIATTIIDNFIVPVIDTGKRVLQGIATLLSGKPTAYDAKNHQALLNVMLTGMDQPETRKDLPADTMTFLIDNGISIQTQHGPRRLTDYLKSIGHPDGKGLDKAQLQDILSALKASAGTGVTDTILHYLNKTLETVMLLRDLLKVIPDPILRALPNAR
ncbi:hypothetical protein [Paludibacterium sp.]|uniref:hypothetical protein n=1 Tax=Paludibacterium sp. TaxID=1917523 RepID=UPI0025E5621E|nr:hypothetical protein [Paludibacterium sp.]MBV8646149.1 hypothetical protein [Paludibacterium sp.]